MNAKQLRLISTCGFWFFYDLFGSYFGKVLILWFDTSRKSSLKIKIDCIFGRSVSYYCCSRNRNDSVKDKRKRSSSCARCDGDGVCVSVCLCIRLLSWDHSKLSSMKLSRQPQRGKRKCCCRWWCWWWTIMMINDSSYCFFYWSPVVSYKQIRNICEYLKRFWSVSSSVATMAPDDVWWKLKKSKKWKLFHLIAINNTFPAVIIVMESTFCTCELCKFEFYCRCRENDSFHAILYLEVLCECIVYCSVSPYGMTLTTVSLRKSTKFGWRE